jgi:hypothetical protein
MKYKPKYSNFERRQGSVASRIKDAAFNDEALKDAMAREIDSFVEAIVEQMIREAFICGYPESGRLRIYCYFGEHPLGDLPIDFPNTPSEIPFIDCFSKETWLDELMERNCIFSAAEFESAKEAVSMAEKFEGWAKRFRETAAAIEAEDSL